MYTVVSALMRSFHSTFKHFPPLYAVALDFDLHFASQSTWERREIKEITCAVQELEAMREEAKLKALPPRYMGKWGSASQAEIDVELEKGTPYTFRFRVPQEGSITIQDLIRGEVCIHLGHGFKYISSDRTIEFPFLCPWLQYWIVLETWAFLW